MSRPKTLATWTYYAVLGVLVVAVAPRVTVHLSRKSKVTPKLLRLETKVFPISYLSPGVEGVRGIRIVFAYSEFQCQDCVLTYLRGLKEATRKAGPAVVQVIGCGELERARYAQWARVHKLDFPFISASEEALLGALPGLELPVIIVIDASNRVVASWKADAPSMPVIVRTIARYVTGQAR